MKECFHIEERDNVATLLQDAEAEEELSLRGAASPIGLTITESISAGHKVAIRLIPTGEHVVKYGWPIGKATRAIQPGEWVHLHNCRSLYDASSSSLNVKTGIRTETRHV